MCSLKYWYYISSFTELDGTNMLNIYYIDLSDSVISVNRRVQDPTLKGKLCLEFEMTQDEVGNRIFPCCTCAPVCWKWEARASYYFQLILALLTGHYFLITTCYNIVTTQLFMHYSSNITWLLHFNIHYFVLLQSHYYLIITCYCIVTTSILLHYFSCKFFHITQLLHMKIRYFTLLQNH